jgi:SnoaL-like domain
MGTVPDSAVRKLVDRAEILDCLARYSRGIDRLDRALVLSAYHPDAIDDHGKFVGSPEEFADWAFAMHRRLHVSHLHAILNHTCELTGDTAHTEAYFLFLSMNKSGRPWSASSGRYLDRFERRGGRWAIAHRVCLRDWAATEAPFNGDWTTLTAAAASLSADERWFLSTASSPARDRRDPSYRRPLTADPRRLADFRAHMRRTRGEEGLP